MKKFTKTLVAVAVLAATASGVAEAGIVSPGDNLDTGSELILNLSNLDKDNSVVVDLGINIDQFLASKDTNFSYTLNAAEFTQFTSLIAAGNNVTWGVYGGLKTVDVPSVWSRWGLYSTSVEPVPAQLSVNFGDTDAAVSKVVDIVLANQTELDASVNSSYFHKTGESGLTTQYADNLGGIVPFTTQAAIGSSLSFIHEGFNLDDFDSTTLETFGAWSLTLNNGIGTLAYTAPSAVPVPAAVWMFGAGLMGMLGLTRRKSVTA